jgi:hypothetical protein
MSLTIPVLDDQTLEMNHTHIKLTLETHVRNIERHVCIIPYSQIAYIRVEFANGYCALYFSLNKGELFPIDVHINPEYADDFLDEFARHCH